jgi:hypothetical protein
MNYKVTHSDGDWGEIEAPIDPKFPTGTTWSEYNEAIINHLREADYAHEAKLGDGTISYRFKLIRNGEHRMLVACFALPTINTNDVKTVAEQATAKFEEWLKAGQQWESYHDCFQTTRHPFMADAEARKDIKLLRENIERLLGELNGLRETVRILVKNECD